MKKPLHIIKTWFERGDVPTQQQFHDAFDSFHHKDSGDIIVNKHISENGNVSFKFSDGEMITIEKFALPNTMPLGFISGLTSALNSKADKITGKGLSGEDFTAEYKAKLTTLIGFIELLQNSLFINQVSNYDNNGEAKITLSNEQTLMIEKLQESKLRLTQKYENFNLDSTHTQQDFNAKIYQYVVNGFKVQSYTVPFQTKIMDLSSQTITEYLSEVSPVIEVEPNQILKVNYYSLDTGNGDISLVNKTVLLSLPEGQYGEGGSKVPGEHILATIHNNLTADDIVLKQAYKGFGFTENENPHLSGGKMILVSQQDFNTSAYDTLLKNAFPKFKFAWGYQNRNYTKAFGHDSNKTFKGNINLLECELLGGLPLLMQFDPKILLYRYKSKRKVPVYIEGRGGITFTKKAKFYHYQDKIGKRKTVIPITQRKTILDFGLEHFFNKEISGTVTAQGMKNGTKHSLYRSKGLRVAHMYIQLKLQITIDGKQYTSPPSEVLKTYFDGDTNKISYQRT